MTDKDNKKLESTDNQIDQVDSRLLINTIKQMYSTLQDLINLRECSNSQYQEETAQLLKDNEQLYEDMCNVENSYCQLKERYMKIRTLLIECIQNQEKYQQENNANEECLNKERQRYDHMKSSCSERISQEIEFNEQLKKDLLKKRANTDAQFQKAMITVEDLQKAIQQKDDQIFQLNLLCDELLLMNSVDF
ncbi:hypothetical protein GJ496_002037 [Pomphorhynchus laevis]|nr:hypothetical protein GJ496_002037 [Pomphorhynchus laevis]